jgi:hypothetical protein
VATASGGIGTGRSKYRVWNAEESVRDVVNAHAGRFLGDGADRGGIPVQLERTVDIGQDST